MGSGEKVLDMVTPNRKANIFANRYIQTRIVETIAKISDDDESFSNTNAKGY
jgi:hypothetical protein